MILQRNSHPGGGVVRTAACLLFLVVLGLPGRYCFAAAPSGPQNVLNEAWSLYKTSKYEEAAAKFQAALKLGESPQAYKGLGMSQYKLGRFQDALGTFQKFKARAPGDWEAPAWAGWAYLRLNRPEEALAQFEESARIQKKGSTYQGIAWACMHLWNFDAALTAARTGVEMDPSNGDNLNAYGWAFYYLGRYPAACAQFEKAVSLRRNDDDFASMMLCYRAQGRYREAIAAADAYMAKGEVRKSALADLKVIQAFCHLALGNYAAARQNFSGMPASPHIGIWLQMKGGGNGPRIHTVFRYSPAFFAGIVPGDTIAAVDDLDLRGKNRTDFWNYVNRQSVGSRIKLTVFHNGGFVERTVAMGITPELVAAAEERRQEVKAHYDRGNDLFEEQNYKGAIEAYGKALELEDTFAPLYHNLAMAQLMAGQKKEAAANLESYLDRRPNASNADEVRKIVQEISGR